MASNDRSATQIVRPPLVCRICGDVARGMNFDVMTCIGCKAFFQRNALRPPDALRCKRRSNCAITLETRTDCAACRLKKCFAFRMKPQLIRSFPRLQKTIYNDVRPISQQIQLPTPQLLGLLQNNRSTLPSEQWNLISNIIRVYDEENLINNIKCLLLQESSLPLRLRVKLTFALSYITTCVSDVQKLIKRSSHFHALPIDSRRALIQHNMTLTSCFNTENMRSESSSIDLIHVQDIFVTILWKYIVYLYGYTEAILRYSSLVKTVLDMLHELEGLVNTEMFERIVSMFVTQTEQLLIRDD